MRRRKKEQPEVPPPVETEDYLGDLEDMAAEFAEHGICPPEEKNRDGG